MNLVSPADRIIVALDLPTVAAAEKVIERLDDAAAFYKIGHHLAYRGGLELARALTAAGRRVFLDLKLHDIGNTVEAGVEAVAELGVSYLTVHAYPQTMKAAVRARDRSGAGTLRLLGVTVLTSYDDEDVREAGYARDVEGTVIARFLQARDAGMDGVVCSPVEAKGLSTIQEPRRRLDLVVPGIRLPDGIPADQKRVATPSMAVAGGADYLVVGRPVVDAADPKGAFLAIACDMALAPFVGSVSV